MKPTVAENGDVVPRPDRRATVGTMGWGPCQIEARVFGFSLHSHERQSIHDHIDKTAYRSANKENAGEE